MKGHIFKPKLTASGTKTLRSLEGLVNLYAVRTSCPKKTLKSEDHHFNHDNLRPTWGGTRRSYTQNQSQTNVSNSKQEEGNIKLK